MYFTGELMYVKTGGRRKEIRRGDSLKGVLSDERIEQLKRMDPPRASDVHPYDQRVKIASNIVPVDPIVTVDPVATVDPVDPVDPVDSVEPAEQTESGKAWFGGKKK